MAIKLQDYFKEQAKIFKVLAHPSRLAIINRLAEGPATVSEILLMFDSDQSTISKHLSLLKFAGIVDDNRKGRIVEYRLIIPCVIEFLTCATKLIQEKK